MFTGKQIDDGEYVRFVSEDTDKPLNVGYFAPANGLGPYLMAPIPPFGGLVGDVTPAAIVGMQIAGDGKAKKGKLSTVTMPRGWPVPPTKETGLGMFHVHEFQDVLI